jgi:putative CRISPR-associated protein (TIGR02619 family)
MRLIVSTCGTSLLTNVATPDERRLVTRYANARRSTDIPAPDRALLEGLIERARTDFLAANLQERAKNSAEFNGLFCYYGRGRFPAPGDLHWLIATDTWLGQSTAAILENALSALGQQAQTRHIADLNTASLESFRIAAAELVRLCAEEIRPMGYPVVFNLTGGFKSVQGFMQALGMLYADETVYVFEGSDSLLRLPRLPIKLDVMTTVREHLRAFRRLKQRLPVDAGELTGVPELFLFSVDGQTTLSEWGEIAWDAAKAEVLGERLWPPIDAKLRYAGTLEPSMKNCSPQELATVNERLDQLARYLVDGHNPRHLDFKKLAAPYHGQTHECDAWHTGGAKRLFGHFERDVFVVAELAEGLH